MLKVVIEATGTLSGEFKVLTLVCPDRHVSSSVIHRMRNEINSRQEPDSPVY